MKPTCFLSFSILWLICLRPLSAIGQTQLAGTVQTEKHQGIPFANVLLLQAKDSSLVKGMVTNQSGNYTLENIKEGHYLLMASMVGYKQSYSSHFAVTGSQPLLQMAPLIVYPQTQQLKQVTVQAIRPFIEQEIDRTVVNVSNSIIASGSTALEVLEKAPGVTIDRQNDDIQLKGKEGVIVQIDGKQTYLSTADVVALLRSTPSDNIDKIELITNPSAKYDAAGNSGIINIRMKKNNNIGTNGSLSIAGGSGRYDRERGSLQVNHRTYKLSLFGNYSANRGGNYWNFDVMRNQADGELRNLIKQDSYLRFRDNGQNTKAGIDYSISKNTTIGLVWTGFWSSHQEEGPASTFFRREEQGAVYMQTETDKTISNISNNQVGNINLQHRFGEKGGQLFFDIDLGRFNRDFDNTLNTETYLMNGIQQPLSGLYTQMPTSITIFTLKADYTHSLSEVWKMEGGLKTSLVKSDNNMTLSSGPIEQMQLDTELSNHFQYSERVNAGYINVSGKLGSKIEVQVGLRAEQTHSTGRSLTLDTKVTRDYLNLFPSLFVSRPLSKDHTLTFSYSYRIDRPNYQSLNPARSYVDPFAFSRGNPYLRPQYTHALELKHGFKNKVFTSLGASYNHDLVFFLVQPVDNQKSERTPENIGKSQSYNLTLSYPLTIMRGWTLQTSVLGLYRRMQYFYQNIPLTVEQVSGRFNGTNSIVLGKGWTAELTGWISTPAIYAIFHTPWLGTVDAGIQKSLGNKWKAKLSVQDLFHTNRVLGKGLAPDFTSNVRIDFDTRIVMLNLTYSFGNGQLNGIRQRKTGSEEEMQRTNSN